MIASQIMTLLAKAMLVLCLIHRNPSQSDAV